MPSKQLAVVSINDEDDADNVAVPAGELEDSDLRAFAVITTQL